MNATTITIYTTPANCTPSPDARIVTASFKGPARTATIAVPLAIWADLETVPEQYRAILDAVLETAVRSILSKHLKAYSLWPSTLDAGYFARDAILDEATGANSVWLSKEELESAWRESATRKEWVSRETFKTSAALRKAVAHYEELVLKLAGKTSQFSPTDLDLILAKLRDEDYSTELGSFIVRRVEAIKNRPAKTNDADVNLL